MTIVLMVYTAGVVAYVISALVMRKPKHARLTAGGFALTVFVGMLWPLMLVLSLLLVRRPR